MRAPHDGSKPGLAPSGGAAATGLNGAQVAHAAPEKRGGGAAATGPNGAQVARTALEWGGGGAAATGFNGGFIGHRDEREEQPAEGMRGVRWRFAPAGGG